MIDSFILNVYNTSTNNTAPTVLARDDGVVDGVGRCVGGCDVVPCVVGSRKDSVELCGLATVEDDYFVVFADVVFNGEHVELRRQCRQDCLELSEP